jgi:hypothetical protein
LRGHEFDVLEVAKPVSPAAAVNLAKIISKLSPLVGNLIEFNTCEYLNEFEEFEGWGRWKRQDPGFPDTVFSGRVLPTPGFEIKAWFPLATEITARFKDSQKHFANDNTYVAMLAWLPEFLIFGKPHVVDIVVVSGASVAKARDDHYHDPPDYLVIEPNDTAARAANLQQTNTAGYKFQGTPAQFVDAQRIVAGWGEAGTAYSTTHEYQTRLATLMAQFPYRLDTNFAKMDRIVHPEIERFKRSTHDTVIHGRTIGAWNRLLSRGGEEAVALALAAAFDIRDDGAASVVE